MTGLKLRQFLLECTAHIYEFSTQASNTLQSNIILFSITYFCKLPNQISIYARLSMLCCLIHGTVWITFFLLFDDWCMRLNKSFSFFKIFMVAQWCILLLNNPSSLILLAFLKNVCFVFRIIVLNFLYFLKMLWDTVNFFFLLRFLHTTCFFN